jgi:CRP/FNR family transcriptional regulator, cyclic AMP receptor protein
MTTQQQSVLGAQPFLRGLSDEHLTRLSTLCQHVAVPSRQRILKEGTTADRFWLIDAGQVTLDATVPGQGRLIIGALGRGDVLGLSWLAAPYQWRFGAITTQPMQGFEFEARAVRVACDRDPALGYELCQRFTAAVVRRLHTTRARLLEAHAHPGLRALTSRPWPTHAAPARPAPAALALALRRPSGACARCGPGSGRLLLRGATGRRTPGAAGRGSLRAAGRCGGARPL